MKQVVLLLLVAVSFSGCSTPTVSQQALSAASGIWSAELFGGSGSATGFSFTTEFTVNPDGDLSLTYFEFLNNTPCFPLDGGSPNGKMNLTTINQATGQVTGTFSFTVLGNGGDTLTLNGNVTGTEVNGTPPLSGGSVTGTWSIKGSSGCTGSSGNFTMTQSTSTSTSTSSSSS
jgi:hypothetical protein